MSSAASASASAIVADTASGHHHLKIDGYSSLKTLPYGRRFSSCPFTVGGHRWRIYYYPNGRGKKSAGHVSVYLVLDEDAAEEVTAWFRFSFKPEKRWFSFLNKAKPAPPPRTSAAHDFGAQASWGFRRFVECEALEQSKHLKRNSFTIRCDIVVINGVRAEASGTESAPKSFLVPPSDLSQHLGDLLLTGKGADVVFEAGGETFAAHRCVLAARSPVFSAELFGSMKEGPGTNDLVRIDDMEPQVFKALLCFVYTDSLPETKKGEEPEVAKEEEPEMKKEEENLMCQHLLVAADRYNMDRLKLICEDKLCKDIDVGTVANILALAEAHHCHVLKSACFDFLGCAANLIAVIASDGFEHLKASCPSVVKELFAMHSPP